MRDVSPCIPSVAQLSCGAGSDGMPLIAATVGVGINVFTPPLTTPASTTVPAAASAGSTSADVLEALFDSALNSGIISTALVNAGIGTAAAPSNVQTARATRAAANGGTCPVPPTGPVVLPGSSSSSACTNKKQNTYMAVMIAFIVAFASAALLLGVQTAQLGAQQRQRDATMAEMAETVRMLNERLGGEMKRIPPSAVIV
jgi:hypothetical protein